MADTDNSSDHEEPRTSPTSSVVPGSLSPTSLVVISPPSSRVVKKRRRLAAQNPQTHQVAGDASTAAIEREDCLSESADFERNITVEFASDSEISTSSSRRSLIASADSEGTSSDDLCSEIASELSSGQEDSDNSDNLTDTSSSESSVQQDEHSEALYVESNVSVYKAVIDLFRLYSTLKWSKRSLDETLQYAISLLPVPHKMPSTVYKLIEYVKDKAPELKEIIHFYCSVQAVIL